VAQTSRSGKNFQKTDKKKAPSYNYNDENSTAVRQKYRTGPVVIGKRLIH
jgi:hypothetical protein